MTEVGWSGDGWRSEMKIREESHYFDIVIQFCIRNTTFISLHTGGWFGGVAGGTLEMAAFLRLEMVALKTERMK